MRVLGNHERFLLDLLEDYPGLEGLLGLDQIRARTRYQTLMA